MIRECSDCGKEYDDSSVEGEFEDYLSGTMGYTGDLLSEAKSRYFDSGFCLDCNISMFSPFTEEFEDEMVPEAPDSDTGVYRSYHDGPVDPCDDALWLRDQ